MTKYIDIVFDGPPSTEAPSFVEVENDQGASISFGSWVERPDGFYALRIETSDGLHCKQIKAYQDASRSAISEAISTSVAAKQEKAQLAIAYALLGILEALQIKDHE